MSLLSLKLCSRFKSVVIAGLLSDCITNPMENCSFLHEVIPLKKRISHSKWLNNNGTWSVWIAFKLFAVLSATQNKKKGSNVQSKCCKLLCFSW